jgi:hypothetical protein
MRSLCPNENHAPSLPPSPQINFIFRFETSLGLSLSVCLGDGWGEVTIPRVCWFLGFTEKISKGAGQRESAGDQLLPRANKSEVFGSLVEQIWSSDGAPAMELMQSEGEARRG